MTLLFAAAVVLYVMREQPAEPSLGVGSAERLTQTGGILEAAYSSTGKSLAYVASEGTGRALFLRDNPTARATKLLGPIVADLEAPQFSPDAALIYYRQSGPPEEGIYSITASGGVPRRIVSGAFSGSISFSPDGNHFAALRTAGDKSELVRFQTDGNDPVVLAASAEGERFIDLGWASRGDTLAVVVQRAGEHPRILLYSNAGASVHPLATPDWAAIRHIEWVSEGNALIVSAQAGTGTTSQLVMLHSPDGQSLPITTGSFSYPYFCVARQAGLLAAVRVANGQRQPAGDLFLLTPSR